jgi:hypothetical protein
LRNVGGNARSGAGDLIAGAVVEGDDEIERGIGLGELDGVVDQPQDIAVEAVAGADHPDLDAVLVQIGEVAPDEAAHQAKQVVDLLARAPPILRGEAEEGEMGDAELERCLDRAADALHPLPVTLGARKPPLSGPTTVAIHDDGNMPRDRQIGHGPGEFVHGKRHVFKAPIG